MRVIHLYRCKVRKIRDKKGEMRKHVHLRLRTRIEGLNDAAGRAHDLERAEIVQPYLRS